MFPTLFYASIVLAGLADDDAPDLCVGDAAPKLEVREFVHGEPLKRFESGKTYVVEFWATWCGPCRESIPHLTALQKKYKQVTFLGVSVEEDVDAVKTFVAKMGDKMDYRVAIDARDEEGGKMDQAWLDASCQRGIPTAYVVNGDGKVAWIGHPKDLEEPLQQILAGKWDLAAKAAEYKEAIAEEQKQVAAQKARKKLADRLAKAFEDKRYDDALAVAEEAEVKEIDLRGDGLNPQVLRLAILVAAGKQTEKAIDLGKTLLKKTAEEADDNAAAVVVALVDPQRVFDPDQASNGEDVRCVPARKLDPALAKLAVEAADRQNAAALNPDHFPSGFELADVHLLLARAYQAGGETEKAQREVKQATEALEKTVRRANAALDKARALQKELGAANDDEER